MKRCTLLIFLFACCVQMYAQKNMYVGLNFINAHDITKVEDEGRNFFPTFAYSPGFEFRIGHSITPVFSLETGLILKEYEVNFTSQLLNPSMIDRFSGFYTAQIPLRIRGHWQVPDKAVTISPVLGYRLAHASSGFKDKQRSQTIPVTDYQIEYFIDRNMSTLISFAELGVDLEFKMSKAFDFTAGFVYVKGFKPITQSTNRYDFNTGNFQEFSATTKGSYAGLNIGIRYNFNPYWIKPALQEVYEKGPQ